MWSASFSSSTDLTVQYNRAPVHPIRASERYAAAIDQVAELLSKLKLDSAFVGGVARAAWLGTELDSGSIDVLALLTPEQKNQVAMMANNRGFHLDREEIDATEELDVIPMRHDGIRVHVLVASNALYGRMVAAAVTANANGRDVRVAAAEDLALLAIVAEDDETLAGLKSHFDRDALNRKLISIGLGDQVIRG